MAGLIPNQELTSAKGVVCSADEITPAENAFVDTPVVTSKLASLNRSRMKAFARGDGVTCFAEGFEALGQNVRTAHFPAGPALQIDRFFEFDTQGGYAGRGYLRVAKRIYADDWFFQAHFNNDPCMPASMIGSGCLQSLCFNLATCGYSLDKDRHLFEPVLHQELDD